MKIMLKMLYRMQKYMDQMDYSANDHSSLTFAQRSDALKQAQRKDAVPCELILWHVDTVHEQWYLYNLGIERALAEFQPDLTEQSESDGEEFVKQGGRPESVARRIWKIWCQELERMPRGGIILFFSDCHNQPEVSFFESALWEAGRHCASSQVLLTMFRKDSIPQYGFPKGKLRPGATPLQGAIREVSENIEHAIVWITEPLASFDC